MATAYKVEILDSTLKPIALIKVLAPMGGNNVLQYSRRLSDFGIAKFRVSTKDPLFKQNGDILQPYANHIRITRGETIVWQGCIVKVPKRGHFMVEVIAYTYSFLLNKVMINLDTTGDTNYRTFKSGTMATAIQTLLTEAKAKVPAINALSFLTIGTIENPDFPAGFVDSNNNALTGTWTFSDNFQLKFDRRSVLYVLQSFGIYAACDFELVQSGANLVFNWKKFLGNKNTGLVFKYGVGGQIDNYNAPLDGDRMANHLYGLAADNELNFLNADKSDSASVKRYGPIEAVAAYADVKNINLLNQRLVEELRMVATPDSELNLTLNDLAYPLGQYDLGDTITANINDLWISVNQPRRIIGIVVDLNNLNNESIELVTNIPRQDQ